MLVCYFEGSGLFISEGLCVMFYCFQGILNPMSGFLNTLAFHGWTGFDVDCSLQRRRELAWDSASTSAANNPIVGSTLLYQSHVQEAKNMTGKNIKGNGQPASDAISVLSEGNGHTWLQSRENDNGNAWAYQGW